jgi:hypothetical protein
VQADGDGDIVGEAGFLQSVLEFSPEDLGEGLDREQEVMVGRQPGTMIVREPTRRDEIMNVRVIGQVASPSVQDADQTELSADKTRILSQLLS